MALTRKESIVALLKGLETGDPEAVTVVDETRYVQHNPQTAEGSVGLAALFKEIAKTNPSVNVVRIFEDGDFVFGHTEYDFAKRNIGFEIFRFEGDRAVEHWDNIQPRLGPNRSGHSMVDGVTEVSDLHLTEDNRAFIGKLVQSIFIERQLDKLTDFFNVEEFTEHNPVLSDDLSGWHHVLSGAEPVVIYETIHRVLAEGNFVLTVAEGRVNGEHSAFYDLFRIDNGKVVEHWDTTEAIPPRSEWKNDNGKF